MDKALLYFSFLRKNHSFVWLVENDVFIPSVQAFRSLHQLYSNTSDLVTPHNDLNLLGDASKWHWHLAVGKFVPPWSVSSANVVGLSRRMLTAIDDCVRWIGEVPFHEYFFTTLALQLNFNLVRPTELSRIVHSGYTLFEEVSKQPNNFWHPAKDFAAHKEWHEKLVSLNWSIILTKPLSNLFRLRISYVVLSYTIFISYFIKKDDFFVKLVT